MLYESRTKDPASVRRTSMRKMMLIVGIVVLASLPALGQEFPKAEVFFGGSLLRADGAPSGQQLFGGWQASLSANFRESIGFTADLGGQYRSILGQGVSQYEYLFGPRLVRRGEGITAFTHFLFGGVTVRSGGSETGFGMAFGAGMDLDVGRRVAIRVVQFDYMPSRFSGMWFNDIRYGFGIVFKAGGG